MYKNATICAKTNHGMTEAVPIKKGVLQGNILSPTLFNIFINDITETLHHDDSPYVNQASNTKTSCLLYADDIVLLSTTKIGLQNQLDRLHEYCSSWGLSVNKTKTKIVIFTKHDPQIELFFKCGENYIEIVNDYKYLGIIFHKTGKFTHAEEHLAKQGIKAMHALRRNVQGKEMQIDIMTRLFDTLVSPVISYGAEVWLPYNRQMTKEHTLSDTFQTYLSPECPTENVHIKFCRSLLGMHKQTMKVPILAELGRFPTSLQMIGQVISFWAHITEAQENSLLKQAYKDMLTWESHKKKWIKFVENILTKMGFGHVWCNQGTLNSNCLKYSISNKLQEKYTEFWRDKKRTLSRLSFYNKITNDYKLQTYLIKCKNKKHRLSMSRLRLSAHELAIEKGRYHNIAAKDRLCKSCATQEDEIHFLDHCSIYDGLRSSFLDTVKKNTNPNSSNLETICCEPYKNPSSILPLDNGQAELAEYVFKCFESRRGYVHKQTQS